MYSFQLLNLLTSSMVCFHFVLIREDARLIKKNKKNKDTLFLSREKKQFGTSAEEQDTAS